MAFELNFAISRDCHVLWDPGAYEHLHQLKILPHPASVQVLQSSGEDVKQWQGLHEVLGSLFEANVRRNDLILAIGGGAHLDVCGLASSLMHRGVDWLAVPTTLLSMADAAYGGKTAINHAGIKNSVGQFHSPLEVRPLFAALKTLPHTHWVSGMGELFKMSLLHSRKMTGKCLELLQEPPSPNHGSLQTLIQMAVELKLRIVAQDPLDQGVRRILNLGHTLGHALEARSQQPHGLCVVAGLYLEARVGMAYGLCSEEMVLLTKKALSVLWPGFNEACIPELLEAAKRDKKNSNDGISLALIPTPGVLPKPFELHQFHEEEILCAFSV